MEGHTDNVPMNSARFPSNWELSASRAVAVARYFQGLGLPAERLAATGYGEHRPVADNADPAGRAANRRVEILLKWRGRETPRRGDLPLAGPEPAPREPAAAEAAPTVPTIIDPVTSKLGRLPGTGGK